MRQGERASAHAAAPERGQSLVPRSSRPARSRQRGTRGTYLQTVPAPSAETAGTSHGCASTHARDPIEELGVSRSATPVWCVTRCRAAMSHAMGRSSPYSSVAYWTVWLAGWICTHRYDV